MPNLTTTRDQRLTHGRTARGETARHAATNGAATNGTTASDHAVRTGATTIVRPSRRTQRHGLAPIEFVLWLPVLLMVMALMVNYGTMAVWRLRGEVVSREAVWRTRFPRAAGSEPRPSPPTWPIDGAQSVAGDAPFNVIDLPSLHVPAIRGPLPNGFVVNQILDPTRGAAYGSAQVIRQYPLLSKAGSYDSGVIKDPLLNGTWTNGEMGIPNWQRRLLVLYQLPRTDPSLPDAFRQAVIGIFQIPDYHGLRVLDRDEDWIEYRGGAPDYHPRVNPRRCSLDLDLVRRQEVNRIIDVRQPDGRWRLGAISLLPRRLTESFLAMYRQTLREFQDELNSMPPPPPDRVAYLQQEIPILEANIAALEEFQPQIRPFEIQLETRP